MKEVYVQILKNTMGTKNYNKVFDNIVDKFLHSAGVYIEGETIKNIERYWMINTGKLRGSVTFQTEKTGSKPESPATQADVIDKPREDNAVDIGTNVEYAQYQEYGTVKMRSRPYIRPALRRSKRPVVNKFIKLIREGLKRGK